MGIVCCAFGAVCLLYYLVISLYAGQQVSFAWIWLAGAAVFLICALILRKSGHGNAGNMQLLKTLCCIFLAGCLLTAGFFGTRVIKGMHSEPAEDLEAILILGAQVRGRVPSRSLKKRLECGLSLSRKMPDAVLILSGGKGPGEEITEAQCMKNYLLTNGVEETRIVLEENSTTTKENLSFSDALTGCGSLRTGIVTNDFHVARAMVLAEKAGYTESVGIPSSSDPVLELHFIVREIFALAALQFFP